MDLNLIMSECKNTITEKVNSFSKEFKIKAAIFLGGVAGISAIVGFSSTLAAAKKQDPEIFNQGLIPTKHMRESGASLALRALGWGTLYSVTGCGILFYTIWKLSGAKNLQDFRIQMGSILPKIPKNNPPVGRTEFTGMNDLLNYLQQEFGQKSK